MPPDATELRNLQSWMMRVVSHPRGAEAGLTAAREDGLLPPGATGPDQIVPPNSRLSSQEQLQIYAFMYFARLVEVLEAEFPTLHFLLGADAFEKMATGYLVAHPSRHYSLGQLSAALPDYLATEARGLPHHSFATDLARVERAMEDVADEVKEEPLSPEALTEIPAEMWNSARLRPIRAMRLLVLDHPVGPFMNAVQQGHYEAVPQPSSTPMCVHRASFTVYRAELEPGQLELLSSLSGGKTLGDALGEVAELPGIEAEALISSLSSWFESWAGDGLFAAVEFD